MDSVDFFEGMKEMADIKAVYARFQDANEMSVDDQLTPIRLNGPLSAFEERVKAKKFSCKLLTKASARSHVIGAPATIEQFTKGEESSPKPPVR